MSKYTKDIIVVEGPRPGQVLCPLCGNKPTLLVSYNYCLLHYVCKEGDKWMYKQ